MVVRNRSLHWQHWSQEEIEILKKYRSSMSSQELMTLLPNRTIKSIENRCQKLGLPDPSAWSPKEIDLINKYTLLGWGINRIARKLKRSRGSVATFKYHHNLTMSLVWTQEEDNILRQNWQTLSDSDLHKILPRHTKVAIGAHRAYLGLTDSSCKKSQGEKKLKALLQVIPLLCIYNKKYDELGGLELDFYYPNIKLGIEYNGAQHYRPVCFGGISQELAEANFLKQQANDKRKEKVCQQQKILLVIVPYNIYLSHKNFYKILQKYCNKYPGHEASVCLQEKTLEKIFEERKGF